MSSPAQMYDHELNGVKGFYPGQPWVVDKAVDFDSAVTAATTYAGMVVHIDPTSGQFKLGCPATSATVRPMAFILFQNGTDFDVVGDDKNFVGAAPTTGTGPGISDPYVAGGTLGRPMGLAVCQGAEVESTEYTGTPTSGDLLFGDTDGVITEVTGSGDVTIIGVVSDGEIQSEHGDKAGAGILKRLRFHTAYVPLFASYT